MAEEGDIVLGIVERIEGTTVFVKLDSGEHGTIITSEIAPGRIRNLREYVVPNKKIVTKVLRVVGENIDLSLRRVNAKERKEIMDRVKQEQAAKAAFKQLLKDDGVSEKKVLKDFESLFDFFNAVRDDEKLLAKYVPKENVEGLLKVIMRRKKGAEVKKIVDLKCFEEDGVERIKKIFSIEKENVKITYISAGKFQINVKDVDYKKANKEMDVLSSEIEKLAKENKCEIEISEK
jgi:translation initiation factor 2 subunit 1